MSLLISASVKLDLVEKTFEQGSQEAELINQIQDLAQDFKEPWDYLVFTDGACRGNPGVGAMAYCWYEQGDQVKGHSYYYSHTTNNQMEMGAVIQFFQEQRPATDKQIFLFSDSQYVVKGFNEWMEGWKRRGWKKGDKKPPENLEMWQQIDQIKQSYPGLKLIWVKGHSGHPGNELCDLLANQIMDREVND